jgi:N,N-dimethylformamidase beta subunit-like, C-terminal/Carbohydrate binding module (family 6)/F5/8 type C domain
VSPDTGSYRHWITLPVATLSLGPGTHALRIVFDSNGANGGVMNLNWLELVPRSLTAPGRIQAEDFDPGGEGVGYHDSTAGNINDLYRRSEGVDVGESFFDDDFTPDVEYVTAGEWLNYTVRAAQSATYVLRARLASPLPGATFHVEVDGANVTGPVAFPNTTSYTNWVTVSLGTVALAQGPHNVRVVFDTEGSGNVGNFNWLELVAENPVVLENQNAGDATWSDNITNGDSPITGYASATSVNRGGSITLYIDSQIAQRFASVSAKVFRFGYYGGTYARLMTSFSLPAMSQAACGPGANGQIECNWSPSYTLAVPASWESGVYVVKLNFTSQITGQTFGNYIPFVVRDDARRADFLYVQPVATYQAYNNYPSHNCFFVSGPLSKSLYTFNSANVHGGQDNEDPNAGPIDPGIPAQRVSFRRPYCGDGAGSEEGSARASDEVFPHELNLIAYLERQGFDVAYATSLDLHHATPASLGHYRAILSAGHDEYWSTPMRDNMEEARDRGIDLAFFGGNPAYWQVRFEDFDQTLTCYKSMADPVPFPLQTALFRDVGRPEQWLVGIRYVACCTPLDQYPPLENLAGDSWVFAASPTPVTPATTVDLTVGNELDSFYSFDPGDPSPGYPVAVFDGASIVPSPPVSPPRIDPSRYHAVAASPGLDLVDPNGAVCPPACPQMSTVYQAPSGAWVFATGTLGWALDLADVGRYFQSSDIIQTATANVFSQFLADGNTPTSTNLAAGAELVARSSYDDPVVGWGTHYALDGRRSSAIGSSFGYASEPGWNTNHEEWVEVRLPTPRSVSRAILFPRNDAGFVGVAFPRDFKIQAWNGATWIDLISRTGYPPPGPTGQSFVFAPTTTDRIRIDVTAFNPDAGNYEMELAEIELYGQDTDSDGVNDDVDDCPTVANADQADVDGDSVGDACDSCVNVANPRVTPDVATYLSANPWATLTGGQRDDDHDGYGNKCDAKFVGAGLVGGPDLGQFRASNNKLRSLDVCGTSGVRPCAIFDLDESGGIIGGTDLALFRSLNNKLPGPKCASCPLPCAAGTAGTCGPVPP